VCSSDLLSKLAQITMPPKSRRNRRLLQDVEEELSYPRGGFYNTFANVLTGKNPRSVSSSVSNGRHSMERNIVSSYAPLQVGSVARGPYIAFGAARNGTATGLRLSGSQAWCDIGMAAAASYALSLPGQSATVRILQFDPNDASNMNDPLHTFADMFVKWRIKELTISYAPISTTADTANPAFALAFVYQSNDVSSLLTTFTAIQAAQNSITFPAYEAWSMKIPLPTDILLGANDSEGANPLFVPGSLVACSNSSTYGSNKRMGTIMIDYVIDFYDMVSQAGTSLCSDCGSCNTTTERQLRRDIRKLEMKSERSNIRDELKKLKELESRSSLLQRPADEGKGEVLCEKPALLVRTAGLGVNDSRVVESIPLKNDGQTPSARPADGWFSVRAPTR